MKGFLLYDDLCGFKKVAENCTADELFTMYAPYLTSTVMPSEDLKISSMVMSDTLLATPSPGDDQFFRICKYASGEGFGTWHRMTANRNSLPIRGAIAYDELMFGSYDVSTQAMIRPAITKPSCQILLGKAVVCCHEHEKNQEWYCTSIVPQNLDSIRHDFAKEYERLIAAGYLVEWDIPLKGNSSVRGAVINSYYSWHYGDLVVKIMERMDSGDDKIKLKYKNTLEFYDYCRREQIVPGFGRAGS